MKQGAHVGLLLDLNSHVLELYIDKTLVGSVSDIPDATYYPAFYTRTRNDRITLISNPTLPME